MNKKRVLAGAMAVTMGIGSIGMSGTNVYAAETNEKEEVIYVITDASGEVESVNAVNIFGKGDVTDYGDYSAVKMLNTTDPIQLDGDKVTFTSDKDKVYYQGTLENVQLPWKVKITYTLDGKEITAKDLAGKAGALEIHITAKENTQCKSDFYDSTALQATLTLDTEKCENIEAEGATLANVGSNKQISYTALPGKGLDATVKADVTDFEMDAIAINGVALDLDIDIDDAELMDKVMEIMDAAKELNDGATELKDGTDTLKNGGNNLVSGAASLNTGIASLNSGITSLNTGVGNMQKALNTLNAQSGTLTSGSAQVLTALQTIQTQLTGVSVTAEQLKQLTDSSAAIKQGITGAYNGAVALQTNLSYSGYKAAMQSGGLDIDQLQSGNAQAIQTISTQINSLSESIAALKAMPDYEQNAAYQKQVQQLEAQINSLKNVVTLLNGNNAMIAGTSKYFDATAKGCAELVTGLEQLKNNYETFDAAIGNLATTLSDLSVKVSTLKGGIDQLVTSYQSLDAGITSYTQGVAAIVSAYSEISTGTGNLLKGSKKLVTGSKTLKEGSKTLYSGITTLQDGTNQLSDGTKEFYEKTDNMDAQVEDTIDEMLDSLSGGDAKVESFVSDKNENVESVQFVIKTAAVEKAETETKTETKQEKTSVIDKVLNLFRKEK